MGEPQRWMTERGSYTQVLVFKDFEDLKMMGLGDSKKKHWRGSSEMKNNS